jgi:hypothetical protein
MSWPLPVQRSLRPSESRAGSCCRGAELLPGHERYELRTDVKDSQENSLEALKSAKAPDAQSVVQELDEADALDGLTPGGEFIAEELVVQVIPQADDEFTCWSCFLVRHRSQKAREKDGHAYCVDCEG